jgi:hypothetical protein
LAYFKKFLKEPPKSANHNQTSHSLLANAVFRLTSITQTPVGTDKSLPPTVDAIILSTQAKRSVKKSGVSAYFLLKKILFTGESGVSAYFLLKPGRNRKIFALSQKRVSGLLQKLF